MADSSLKIDPHMLLENTAWIRVLARGLLRDEQLVDDVVQQSLLLALSSHPRERGEVRSWLSHVVRRVVYNLRREERRRKNRERRAAQPESSPPTVDVVAGVEVQHKLVEAVLRLTEPNRTTLILRYFHDMNSSEIGLRLEVSAATVRRRLQRAKDLLREDLRNELGEEDRTRLLALLALDHEGELPATASLTDPVRWGRFGAMAASAILGISLIAYFFAMGSESGTVPAKTSAALPDGGGLVLDSISSPVAEFAGTVAAPTGERFRGWVIDAASSDPIADAEISVITHDSSDGTETMSARSSSAADGSFALARPSRRDRSVTVLARAPGYVEGAVYLVAQAPTDSDLIFRLRRGVRITGKVVDERGQPILDAVVLGLSHVEIAPRGSFLGRSPFLYTWGRETALPYCVDDQGRFDMTLQSFRIAIEAKAPGMAPALSHPVAVTGGKDVRLRLVLSPGFTLEGRVVDTEGDPIPEAKVRVYAFPRSELPDGAYMTHSKYTAETGLDGGFRLVGLTRRLRSVEVRHDGHLTYKQFGSFDLASQPPLEVVLEPAQWISGVLLDRGGAPVGPRERAFLERTGGSSRLMIDVEGGFRSRSFPRGASGATLRVPGYAPHEVWWDPGCGEHDLGSLTLEDGAVFQVAVTGEAGAPIDGARVEVRMPLGTSGRRNERLALFYTDDRGRGSCGGLVAGNLVVDVSSPDLAPTILEEDLSELDGPLRVVLRSPARIVGTAIDEAGTPLPGAILRWKAKHEAERDLQYVGTRAFGQATCDVGGHFVVERVPLGAPLILFFRHPRSSPGDRIEIEPLEPGEERNVGKITLSRGATVSGRVVDIDGRPVPGAIVAAQPDAEYNDSDPFERPPVCETDEEGRFRLSGLNDGHFHVYALGKGYQPSVRHPVAIPDDASALLEIVLEPGLVYSGRVSTQDGRPAVGVGVHVTIRSDRGTVSRKPVAYSYYPGVVWINQAASSSVSSYTDHQGRVEFHSLPRGRATLRITPPGGGSRHVLEADSVADLPRRVSLPDRTELEVKLRVKGARPLPLYVLYYFSRDGGFTSGRARLTGSTAVITAPEPGNYRFGVRVTGFPYPPETSVNIVKDQRVQLSIGLDGETAGILLHVATPTGHPAGGAQIFLVSPTDTRPQASFPYHTNPTGAVRIFRADAPGVELFVLAQGFASFASKDARSLIQDDEIRVNLRPQSAIEYSVQDADGAPVDGVTMSIEEAPGDLEALFEYRGRHSHFFAGKLWPVSKNGKVRIDGLPAGRYTIGFRGDGTLQTVPPIRIKENMNTFGNVIISRPAAKTDQ